MSKNESEFTQMVSRGKLDFPRENLFDLSLYLYGYYKIVIDKECINRLLTAFRLIYEYTGSWPTKRYGLISCQ